MRRCVVNKTIASLTAAARDRTLPKRLSQGRSAVAKSYADFERIMSEHPEKKIYGVNQLPGHKDTEQMPDGFMDKFQRALIDNHCLPSTEAYDPEIGVYVTLAKASTLAAGGSTISAELYDRLVIAAGDPQFSPVLPRNMSYSSGDVIPGAHWAQALLAHASDYALKPGEGMALINGSFVHLGLATYAVAGLDLMWRKFLITTRNFFRYVRIDDAFFEYPRTPRNETIADAVAFVSEFVFPPETDKVQPYVSVRATPQVLEGLYRSVEQFTTELEIALDTPTGNPQLRADPSGDVHIVPTNHE